RALVDADEVDEREQREGQQRPGPDLVEGDLGRVNRLGRDRRRSGGDVGHGMKPPRDCASRSADLSGGPSSWLPADMTGHSGATAPDSHRLPRTVARAGKPTR